MGRTERLKSRKRIEQLFKTGRSFTVPPFRLYYLFDTSSPSSLQAGFGVPIKHFKKAVDRNRVKRLMKEAYRMQKTELLELVYQKKLALSVFLVYATGDLPHLDMVNEKIKLILQRLIKIINESPSSAS